MHQIASLGTIRPINPIFKELGRSLAYGKAIGQTKSMNGAEVLEIGRDTIVLMFKVSLPLMLITLAVGLTVSLFQAVTQIQEATLTFVPKIIIIFTTLYLLLPFIGAMMGDFMLTIADRIVNGI